MNYRKYLRPLSIPWIPGYKDALQWYAEKLQECEELAKHIDRLEKEQKKETRKLKETIEEQKKQIDYQLKHLARYAPWGLEKKTPKQYEDQYWASVQWGNEQIHKLEKEKEN